jgi:hypothetical protein
MSALKAIVEIEPSFFSDYNLPFMSTTRPVPAQSLIYSIGIPNPSKVSFKSFCVMNSLNPPSGF